MILIETAVYLTCNLCVLASSLPSTGGESTSVGVLISSSSSSTVDAMVTVSDIQECSLRAVDPLINKTVAKLLQDKVSLVEYHLSFANYTYNPLTNNVTWLYSGDTWSRITKLHGQVISHNISPIRQQRHNAVFASI